MARPPRRMVVAAQAAPREEAARRAARPGRWGLQRRRRHFGERGRDGDERVARGTPRCCTGPPLRSTRRAAPLSARGGPSWFVAAMVPFPRRLTGRQLHLGRLERLVHPGRVGRGGDVARVARRVARRLLLLLPLLPLRIVQLGALTEPIISEHRLAVRGVQAEVARDGGARREALAAVGRDVVGVRRSLRLAVPTQLRHRRPAVDQALAPAAAVNEQPQQTERLLAAAVVGSRNPPCRADAGAPVDDDTIGARERQLLLELRQSASRLLVRRALLAPVDAEDSNQDGAHIGGKVYQAAVLAGRVLCVDGRVRLGCEQLAPGPRLQAPQDVGAHRRDVTTVEHLRLLRPARPLDGRLVGVVAVAFELSDVLGLEGRRRGASGTLGLWRLGHLLSAVRCRRERVPEVLPGPGTRGG
eukprot:4866482-Prymnesium_polylepis.2